ncbi:hypothetical protein K3179_10780 [Qipengyuania sp. GH38]|uniref:hypothetical protein n=1 Tax=Qipengyuania intermedia TaxID=2867244 RepID=UPI001C87C8BA|nr:hypothetical protein [Qipengyuania intermedia]MBX7515026.1 hypothetical protein [Qipengyuania intermedia]
MTGKATSGAFLGPLLIALPVIGGLFVFLLNEAPSHFALVNSAALLIGLLSVYFLRAPEHIRSVRYLVVGLLLVLCLPMIVGPSIDGVTRWLPLGPVQLHSGQLLIPPLAVLSVRLGNKGMWPVAGALLICGLQPDAASCLALTLVLLALALRNRDWKPVLLALLGLAVTAQAWWRGALPPVVFVENLLPFLWLDLDKPVQAIAIGLLLCAPFAILAFRQVAPGYRLVWIAAYGGFLIAALFGPYPVPLAGYGAAPIIGMLAGLAMMRPEKGLGHRPG